MADSRPQNHTKVLTAAARAILQPVGLFQKGRSRTWLDDHGWWLVVVEFQPSSWSKGSYLNVGCCWLWRVKDYLTFDEGGRLVPFSGFRDEEQFRCAAQRMAHSAAEEVRRYRKLFPSLRSVCSFYLQHAPTGFWPTFDAAIACALSGEPEQAQRFFGSVVARKSDDREWVLAAQDDARRLNAMVLQPERLRETVNQRIQRTRALLKLPAVPSVDLA